MLNHTNIKFHILNPGIKNITKTRSEISEIKSLDKAAYKSKGLSEYSDLTRVSAPNPNKNFNEAFKTNQNAFNQSSNVCQNYFDIYTKYGTTSEIKNSLNNINQF